MTAAAPALEAPSVSARERSALSRVELQLAGAAFFASGAAGLVYQVSWQRILALQRGVGI